MYSHDKKSILLVEDEAVIAMTEKMEMRKYGYLVHQVATAEQSVIITYEEVLPIDYTLGRRQAYSIYRSRSCKRKR